MVPNHAARMTAYWCLSGNDAGMVAAVDYAATFGAGGVGALPRAVATALAASTDSDVADRDALAAALDARAARAGYHANQTGAAAVVIGMCRLVRDALPEGPRLRLEQR